MTYRLDLALDEPDSPQRGDLLVGPRMVHRVLDARPCESLLWPNRWTLRVEPVGRVAEVNLLAVLPDGRRTWHSRPYRRGERPADHFAEIERLSGRTLPPDGEIPGYVPEPGDGRPPPAAGAPPGDIEEAPP